MATQLQEDRFMRILWDEETRIIRIDWMEATSAMNDEEFKRALGWVAGHVTERKARGLLIDVRHFRHEMSAEVHQWRLRTISPRYNAAGLERLAFLFPNDADIPLMANQSAAGEGFATRGFNTQEHATAWLAARV